MSKPNTRHRTALVLGADNPAGRSIAMMFSRTGANVVLAGYDADKLKILADLIEAKKGDPLVTVIPREKDRIIPVLRAARETMGHYHYVVNALAASDPPSDQPQAWVETASQLQKHVWEVVEGRGSVRFLILWPDNAHLPVPAVPDERLWHCAVRYDRIQLESEDNAGDAMRAAGVADTVGQLLASPASACPVEVRIAIRELKSRPGE
ncbi:hypothetical protein GC173_17540 [bacterium]|nr:hypothetical protein [bacterium]